MPAGPSEVEVIADETAVPAFVARPTFTSRTRSRQPSFMLITTSETLANAVMTEVETQWKELPRKDIAEKSLANSKIIIVKTSMKLLILPMNMHPNI